MTETTSGEAMLKGFDALREALGRHALLRYGFAACAVFLAASLLGLCGRYYDVTPFIVFFPAVMIAALFAGLGAGLFATFLAAALAHQFFLGPEPNAAASFLILAIFTSFSVTLCVLIEALQRGRRRDLAHFSQKLDASEETFRLLVEGVRDHAIFMLDPEGNVTTWNVGAQKIKGWPAGEILGKHFSVFYPQESRDAGLPQQLLQEAALHSVQREEMRVRYDGTKFWASITITPIHDEKGKLRGFGKVTQDISERKQAERGLAENRALLASTLEYAMDAIITIDQDQRIVFFNSAAATMFRIPAEDAMGTSLEQFIPERFRKAHSGHVRGFDATGVTGRAMGKLGTLSGLRHDGEEFPIEASISQAEIEGRKFLTAIVRDISDRNRMEKHQTLLLRELSHRVKNSLAVVQAIASLTRRHSPPERFHADFSARLLTLGGAHDLLTSTDWAGAPLADIVALALAPYNGRAAVPRYTYEGPNVWLAPNEAVTLSLLLHELATNAAKFGALSTESGRVCVSWKVDEGASPKVIDLLWREEGGPPVTAPDREGFGSTLIKRAVEHELKGDVELTFAAEGVQCRLRFPVSDKIRVQP